MIQKCNGRTNDIFAYCVKSYVEGLNGLKLLKIWLFSENVIGTGHRQAMDVTQPPARTNGLNKLLCSSGYAHSDIR